MIHMLSFFQSIFYGCMYQSVGVRKYEAVTILYVAVNKWLCTFGRYV